MRTAIFLLGVRVLSPVPQAHTATFVVSPDGTGDFLRIQEAIRQAASGDEVIVRPGTYQENVNFMGKDLWVHSSEGRDSTTIVASSSTPEFRSCVIFISGESVDAILEGFTLTGGQGTYYAPSDTWIGGAVFCGNAGCTLRSCRSVANRSWNGGALFFTHSDVSVSDCEFLSNVSEAYGAALNGTYTAVSIQGCLFRDNQGVYDGALALGEGTIATVRNCTLQDNRGGSGAGLNIGAGTVGCTIRRSHC